MSTAAEDLVWRYTDEVINGQRVDQVDALFQPDVIFRDPAFWPGSVTEEVDELSERMGDVGVGSLEEGLESEPF